MVESTSDLKATKIQWIKELSVPSPNAVMIKAMGDGNCNEVGRFTEAPVGDSKFEELSKASAPFLQNPCLISLLGACSPLDGPGIWVILLSQSEGMGDVRGVGNPGTSTQGLSIRTSYHQGAAIKHASTRWRHGRACSTSVSIPVNGTGSCAEESETSLPLVCTSCYQ